MNTDSLTDDELEDLAGILLDEDSFIGALDNTYDQIVGTFKGSFGKFTTGKYGTINITLNVSGRDRHDCLELQDTEDLVLQFVAMRRSQKPTVDFWTTERGTVADIVHDLNYRNPQTGHVYAFDAAGNVVATRPFAPTTITTTATDTSESHHNATRTPSRPYAGSLAVSRGGS